MKKMICHHEKLPRLKKIQGQIRAVERMIADSRYCVDILHTVGAAIGALKKLEAAILKDHLKSCVKTAFSGKSPREQDAKLFEIYGLIEGMRK